MTEIFGNLRLSVSYDFPPRLSGSSGEESGRSRSRGATKNQIGISKLIQGSMLVLKSRFLDFLSLSNVQQLSSSSSACDIKFYSDLIFSRRDDNSIESIFQLPHSIFEIFSFISWIAARRCSRAANFFIENRLDLRPRLRSSSSSHSDLRLCLLRSLFRSCRASRAIG